MALPPALYQLFNQMAQAVRQIRHDRPPPAQLNEGTAEQKAEREIAELNETVPIPEDPQPLRQGGPRLQIPIFMEIQIHPAISRNTL